jgi:acyl carrier protein
MVQKGARNLIFVSRHGASSAEATALIHELEASGVRTKVLECDITDESRLSDSLSLALEDLPPLHGVIQGAMVLQDQVFSNMSYDAFMSCLRPKVKGSWSLHQATLQQPLDFFLLLSSCASFWGNAGQSNYAAGCTYQVALAAHRRSLGLPATAIDIGKVASVGFVAENAGTTSERNLVKLGLLDISEDELLLMLETAMLPPSDDRASHMPNGHLLTGVSSSNDPAKGMELPFWSRDPVFSHLDFVRPHLRRGKGEAEGTNAAAAQKQLPLPDLLSSANTARDADKFVLDALLQKLARALLMALEDMDAQKPTAEYGVDSLIAVELRNWFSREAKVEVPVFEILQAASLAALASMVAAKSPLVKVTA